MGVLSFICLCLCLTYIYKMGRHIILLNNLILKQMKNSWQKKSCIKRNRKRIYIRTKTKKYMSDPGGNQ